VSYGSATYLTRSVIVSEPYSAVCPRTTPDRFSA
jgi:hypothetical protein